ncbi:hypothetical protein AVEN_144268-1 [Araneus ventricosus]|uniref:Uncharacterized protein n=1 Tax=Araneus ventricosus TaxID=182803 RepID=A0A4Y2H8P5_ARAVE|nr:hypothetical protein AVEN_144268-1 [Araneus ventricosus]
MLKIHRDCEPLELPISHVGEVPITHSAPAHSTRPKAYNRNEERLVWYGSLEKRLPSQVSSSLPEHGSIFQGLSQNSSHVALKRGANI